jgi:hypothetical protein
MEPQVHIEQVPEATLFFSNPGDAQLVCTATDNHNRPPQIVLVEEIECREM